MTATTVFVECVSCGRELVLADHDLSDDQAALQARKRGWTVRGFRGAQRTRCRACRRSGRRDTHAADEGRIGNNAGWQSPGRRR